MIWSEFGKVDEFCPVFTPWICWNYWLRNKEWVKQHIHCTLEDFSNKWKTEREKILQNIRKHFYFVSDTENFWNVLNIFSRKIPL
jgi:hypothetical protein